MPFNICDAMICVSDNSYFSNTFLIEMEIVSATSSFDFKAISLADPHPLNGHAGFYFTQLGVGAENKPLYLQLPECVTKQGMVNIKNTKYLDLMFERSQHDALMTWIEKLEYTCQDIIDTKKDLWFQTELTRDDIETMMTQSTRLYQSGKYILMRVFIETQKGLNTCIAYNENEIGVDLDTLEANKPLIPLIQIEGVKFSARSFEIVLKLTQVMVLGKTEKKTSCLIKRPGGVSQGVSQGVSSPNDDAPHTIAPHTIAPPTIATPITQAPIIAPPVVQAPVIAPNIVQAPIIAPPTITPPTPAIIKSLEQSNDLEDISIQIGGSTLGSDTINLKNPNEVYYEIYRKAREKAKEWRLKAIESYLEAKEIKTKYMLFDMDDSDDSMDDSDDEEEEEEP